MDELPVLVLLLGLGTGELIAITSKNCDYNVQLPGFPNKTWSGGDLFCLMLIHKSDLEPVSRSDGGRNLYTSNMGQRFLHCCRV